MTSRLRLDVLPQVDEQIVHGPQEGGTDDRRAPIVREGAGRPDTWGLLDGYAALFAATEEVCGIGTRRVLGPRKG